MNEPINVVRLRQPDDVDDPLTNVLRAGARTHSENNTGLTDAGTGLLMEERRLCLVERKRLADDRMNLSCLHPFEHRLEHRS